MLAARRLAALLTAILLATTACSAGTTPASPGSLSAPPVTPPSETATPTPLPVLPGEAWIAYEWWQPGKDTPDLFLVRPDGSDAHPIATDVPGEKYVPSWSPDGKKIAFANKVWDLSSSVIWTANADGTGAAPLTDGGATCDSVFHPSFSPDGSKLVMVCYTEGAEGPEDDVSSVATLDLATSKVTPIAGVTWPEFLDDTPRWSPDGTSIAFDIVHWDPTNKFLDGTLVATVPAAGGKVHRLTTFDTFMAHPDWRPDGKELVTDSYDLGNISTTDQPSNLYAIKPDGSGLRQLTHSSVDGTMRITQPRWAPDGKRIVVSIGTSPAPGKDIDDIQLAFVDAAGGEPVLLSPAVHGSWPELRPTR